jgi:hypothetical protein
VDSGTFLTTNGRLHEMVRLGLLDR